MFDKFATHKTTNMATLKNFEELDIWKESIQLAKEIYTITQADIFKNDWSLRDQIRRAVVSISNNIAEGFEHNNNIQFVRYLKIAKASCGEVRSMIFLLLEIEFITNDEKDFLYEKANHLNNKIGSLISYLQKEKLKQLVK